MAAKSVGSLGERLRTARTLGAISARELDRLAGITPGHANSFESGRRTQIEVRIATRLAGVLGLSLDWFLTGTGQPPKAPGVLAAVERARVARAVERDTGT